MKYGAVHRNGVRKRGPETGHLVETGESYHATVSSDAATSYGKRASWAGSTTSPLIRSIDAQSDRGRGTQTVLTDDHRQRDEVDSKFLRYVVPKCVRAKVFQNMTLRLNATGVAISGVVRRTCSSAKRSSQRKVRMNVLTDGVKAMTLAMLLMLAYLGTRNAPWVTVSTMKP